MAQADSHVAVEVDAAELRLPAAWSGTLDVAFDGRRIFSIDPDRHPVRTSGVRSVRWPPQLRTHLDGRTRLTISRHDHGDVLAELEAEFGDADRRIAVVDDEGHPLAADKWGRLSRTFESLGAAYGAQLLDEVDALMADVRAILDAPVFVAYGTLLGAVREGDFIGHDTDADIAYLSSRRHPSDIAAEAFRLQRALVERGWCTHRSTTTFLQVWRAGGEGEPNRIDIFTAYFLGDAFALDCWVRGPLRRDHVLPLREVELAGRRLPGPAVPEELLALTYGPGWRTPDPAFRFAVPRSTSSRAYGYFNRPFVREAISVDPALSPPAPGATLQPSEFARWVWRATSPHSQIVDVRLGVGHDATWLATEQRNVRAFDVKDNSRPHRTDRADLAERLRFDRLPIHELRRVVAGGATLVAELAEDPVISAFRVPDQVRAAGRENFWLLVRMLLNAGGTLLIETADAEATMTRIAELGGEVVERAAVAGEEPHARIRAHWVRRSG